MKLRSRFSPLSLALRLCAIVVPFILPNWLIGPVAVRAKSLVLDQRREPGENESFQACGSNLRFLLDSICYAENRGGYYNPTPRTIPATYRHGVGGGQNLGFQLLRQRLHTPGEIPVRALREAPITDECCRKPCDRTELLKYCASSNERTYRNDIRAHYNPATVPTTTTATTTTTAATPSRIEIHENEEMAFIPCLVQTLWGLAGTRSKDHHSCQRMLIKTLNGDQEDATLTMSNTNTNRNSDPRLITNSQTRPSSEEPTVMATVTGRRHNNGRNIIERDVHSLPQPRHRIQSQNPYLASRSRPRHTPTKSSDEIGIDDSSSQDHSTSSSSSSSSSNSDIKGSSLRHEMELESVEQMIVMSPIISMAEVFMDDVRSGEVFAIPAETNSVSLRRNFHGD